MPALFSLGLSGCARTVQKYLPAGQDCGRSWLARRQLGFCKSPVKLNLGYDLNFDSRPHRQGRDLDSASGWLGAFQVLSVY